MLQSSFPISLSRVLHVPDHNTDCSCYLQLLHCWVFDHFSCQVPTDSQVLVAEILKLKGLKVHCKNYFNHLKHVIIMILQFRLRHYILTCQFEQEVLENATLLFEKSRRLGARWCCYTGHIRGIWYFFSDNICNPLFQSQKNALAKSPKVVFASVLYPRSCDTFGPNENKTICFVRLVAIH